MTSTNRVQLSYVRGVTPGVLPASPRMRKVRYTGESLIYKPEFQNSDEVRDDRMMSDPFQTIRANSGVVNTEFSYPVPDTFQSDALQSLFYSTWANTPSRDNDGIADSVITDIGGSSNTITFVAGPAFVAGQVVRTTGFAAPANNGVFPVTTGGATSLVSAGAGFVAEPIPPAAARVKAVGLQGAAADLAAVTDGITSTALSFTTFGLQVGQWISVGGTGATFRFATAANNGWARIIGIAANKLTLDNLPTGWAADAGAGKTIRLWYGDVIRNGVTKTELHFEKGYLGQAVPTFIQYYGDVVNTGELAVASRGKATANYTFMGLGGSLLPTVDAVADDPTTSPVMAGNANVGRVAEAGARLSAPNWCRSFSLSINNNLRQIDDVQQQSPVDTREGECAVTVKIEPYFGDSSLLSKFYAGTPTNVNSRWEKNGQAVIWTAPRLTYTDDGSPQVGGKNQDVMLPLTATASKDPLTACQIQADRIEYFEN